MAHSKDLVDLFLSILVLTLCFICVLAVDVLVINDVSEELRLATALDAIAVSIVIKLDADSHVFLVDLVD